MRALAVLLFVACTPPHVASAVAPITARAIVTEVHAFTLGDGTHPRAPLTVGPDGRLYGTTWMGGLGGGTVYAVATSGELEVLHTFSALDAGGRNADGYGPVAPLVVGPDGRLYGTARQGGAGGNPLRPAPGVLFAIGGKGFETLHSFGSLPGYSDGVSPSGVPVLAGGDLYGATNSGTIWRWDGKTLTAAGVVKSTLYGSPTLGADGQLYGAAWFGGPNGRGFVYKLEPSTGKLAELYDFRAYEFTGNTDDAPLQSLYLASDGALYGTAAGGGPNGTGLIYKVSCGNVTVLHEFGVWSSTITPRFSNQDGARPLSTPVEGKDGFIYGTSYYGGSSGVGSIWRIGKDGEGFETLYSFVSGRGAVGNYPYAGLTIGADGALYGTTFQGGADGYGAVYRMTL